MRSEPLALFLSRAFRSALFGRAIGEAIPALHERMAHVAELGLPPVLGFRVGRALMRVVLTHLAVKVRFIIGIAILGLLRLEAFVQGPRLDQGAINQEMLVRQKVSLLVFEKLDHELLEYIALLKAFPVIGEDCRIPDRVVRRQTDEPTKQQIAVELLDQLALGADRVKHLQQQRHDRRNIHSVLDILDSWSDLAEMISTGFPGSRRAWPSITTFSLGPSPNLMTAVPPTV